MGERQSATHLRSVIASVCQSYFQKNGLKLYFAAARSPEPLTCTAGGELMELAMVV